MQADPRRERFPKEDLPYYLDIIPILNEGQKVYVEAIDHLIEGNGSIALRRLKLLRRIRKACLHGPHSNLGLVARIILGHYMTKNVRRLTMFVSNAEVFPLRARRYIERCKQ
jgi:hypothetical protein